MKKIKIGTRGSLLALAQANIVKGKILDHNPDYSFDDIDIEVITTSGDIIQNRNLAEIGGKGLFTKEIEEALLLGYIDIAVHSMKDMPVLITSGLKIDCFLKREDPRDALISISHESIDDLKSGAVIGTSSARRKAQLLNIRNDLKIIPFRGNVTTRIEKLAKHQVDATLLAMAGLNRLNIDPNLYTPLDTNLILPAVAQGAIAIQTEENNYKIDDLIKKFNCKTTEICIKAERAYLTALGASCTTSVAALAEIENEKIIFNAEILRPDGSEVHKIDLTGSLNEYEKLGKLAAEKLMERAGENFFNSCI